MILNDETGYAEKWLK